MKFFKKINEIIKNLPVKYFVYLILIITLISCQVVRIIVYNFANITDYKIFPSRKIENKSSTIFEFARALENFNLNDIEPNFDTFLSEHETVAFLVIQNDTIKYEKYFNEYNDSSIVASFSMAKSITSILIGCAIDDGLIKSVNEPITNYIPELKKNGFDKVTIEHLLQMTSGLDFTESYMNPFDDAAAFYYGTNLRKAIMKLKLKNKPGTKTDYVSGNTQLLGLVLERALKNKTISAYLEEKIWTPLQMEYDASWSIDREENGLEKTFCCINARARDFAKIGRLYLHKGNWNGKQIVSQKWVANSTKIDTLNGSVKWYQYQWWIFPKEKGDFMAEGILGQFIFVSPSKNLIIVRLGKSYAKVKWPKLFEKIKRKL